MAAASMPRRKGGITTRALPLLGVENGGRAASWLLPADRRTRATPGGTPRHSPHRIFVRRMIS